MSFANPEISWLLFLLPGLGLLLYAHAAVKQRKYLRLVEEGLLENVLPNGKNAKARGKLEAAGVVAVAALLVMALLQPRWGFQWQETSRRGFDLVVALDLSESMNARDISPSRLDRARHELIDLVGYMQGERLGLVSFAGVSFIESPLTLDYAAFRMFLEGLSSEDMPIQGTNIEIALEKSLSVLTMNKEVNSSQHGRAILLVTDGEELQGDLSAVRPKLEAAGVKVFVVGVGSGDGAPIPAKDGYKRDDQGKMVLTRMNTAILEQVAKETGGVYVSSIATDDDTKTLYKLGMKRLLSEGEIGSGDGRIWNEYFQLPLFISLLIMIFYLWGSANSIPALWRKNSSFALLLLLNSLLLSIPTAHADSAESVGKDAYDRFQEGSFAEAEAAFRRAQEEYGDDHRYLLGEAASSYRQDSFAKAFELFSKAAEIGKTPEEQATALFNAGNSLVQEEKLNEALEIYEKGLKLTPEDEDIKANLAYVKKLLEEQKQEQKNEQNKNSKQSNAEKKKSDEKKSDQNKSDQSKSQQSKSEQSKEDQNKSEQSKTGEGESEQENPKDSKPENSQSQSGESDQQEEKDQGEKQGKETQEQKQGEKDNQSGSNSDNSDSNENSNKQKDESKEQNGSTDESNDSSSGSTHQPTPTPTPETRNGRSENQDQSEDRSEDRSEDKSDNSGDTNSDDSQEQSGKGGSGGQERESSAGDKGDQVLDSVEENIKSRQAYRYRKGLEQLKAAGEKPPEKDW